MIEWSGLLWNIRLLQRPWGYNMNTLRLIRLFGPVNDRKTGRQGDIAYSRVAR